MFSKHYSGNLVSDLSLCWLPIWIPLVVQWMILNMWCQLFRILDMNFCFVPFDNINVSTYCDAIKQEKFRKKRETLFESFIQVSFFAVTVYSCLLSDQTDLPVYCMLTWVMISLLYLLLSQNVNVLISNLLYEIENTTLSVAIGKGRYGIQQYAQVYNSLAPCWIDINVRLLLWSR